MNKAKDFFWNNKYLTIVLTFFPYQISCGLSLGIFDGIRIRLYILFFKAAININTRSIFMDAKNIFYTK